jgi:hypothetical protein
MTQAGAYGALGNDTRDRPLTQGHHGSATINRWVPMRACARVALVLMIVSASFGLAACGAIDDLRDTVSRWFDVGSPGRPGSADARPHATPMITPESKKSLKNEASKASKKKDKLATNKVHRPKTAEQKLPTTHTIEAAKPQRAELQSVPSQPGTSGLRTFWPEAPPSGTFSP